MGALSENTVAKLNKTIENLIKTLNNDKGGGAMSTSSDVAGSSSKDIESAKALNKIIEANLAQNAQFIAHKKTIQDIEEEHLKLASKDNRMQDQKTKYIQKIVELKNLEELKGKRMTKAQREAHNLMVKTSKEELKIEAKKYSELEKRIDAEEKLQEIKDKWLEDHKDEVAKLEAKMAKDAKKREFAIKKEAKLREWAGNMSQSISSGLLNIARKIKDTALEQDSAMSKLSSNYAFSREQSKQLKLNMTEVAINTALIGVDSIELAKSQAAYTDELGRSVMLSKEGLRAVAEIGVATGIGAEGAAKMAAEMELFGYNAVGTAEHVESLMKKSRRSGMSTSVMTKKFQDNLKIANSYTFKNGIKGVSDMTRYSSKFRINMQSIAGFADKISNPEGAIQTAASLQVLGGSFAQMADPMKLLNQGITDMEGLTETYKEMLSGVAKVNKETGEVSINGYDRLRMKAAAESMGISFDEMMETARTSAKRTAIESSFSINAKEEDKDLIASLAQFNSKTGKFELTVGGKTKAIAELSKADIAAIQPKDDSLNLRTVAENTLGLKETIQNGLNSILSAITYRLMPILSDLTEWVGKIFSWIAKRLGSEKSNALDGSIKGGKAAWQLGRYGAALARPAGTAAAMGGAKLGAGIMGKAIPGIGAIVSAGLALKDLSEGDYVGAGLQVLSGAASFIPGIGTAASIGISAIDAGREFYGGGGAEKVNDVLIPSKGRPVRLDSRDDVFAAKPGGAIAQAISPSTDVRKTFGGVSSGYSNSYSGGSSVGGSITLNVNGTINLVGGGNSTKISASELMKDKNFVRELTRMIGTQVNRDENGGKLAGGLNNIVVN